MMTLSKEFLRALEGLCAVRQGDAVDALDPGFHPDNLGAGVVALPKSTQEVRAIVNLCRAHKVPIVPHGGRTGLAGAGASVPGQLIVDLKAMNKIVELDADTGTICVQAGATLQEVQEACAAHGLTPGIDLAARGTATIGGMIATNAGGMEAFRCGVMRHRVLGLEAVLPDGSLLADMTRVSKANVGLDIKHMLVGAEGRLGIVTAAVLKLDALPARRRQRWSRSKALLQLLRLFTVCRREAGCCERRSCGGPMRKLLRATWGWMTSLHHFPGEFWHCSSIPGKPGRTRRPFSRRRWFHSWKAEPWAMHSLLKTIARHLISGASGKKAGLSRDNGREGTGMMCQCR